MLQLLLCGHVSTAQNLLDGLIVHYPLNGNAQDIGVNGLHATVSGAVLGPDQDGNPNSAYYFNGVNNFINFPNDPLLKPQFPFTVAVMAMFETPPIIENSHVFTTDFQENNYHGAFMNLLQGRIAISFGGGAGNTNPPSRRTKLGVTVLNAFQWYRMTFILRGALDMEIYIDCVNDGGDYSGTGPTQILYSNIPGCLGRMDSDFSGPPHYFLGAISDFRMWDRELTEFEITYMCNEVEICNTTITGEAVICNGSAAQLSAQAQTFVGWAQADAPGQIISAQPQVTVTPTVTTTYLAYTACDTVQFVVQVTDAPNAVFSLENPSGCPPLEVQFTDQSGLGSDVIWQWDFGDGATSNVQHPVHVYTASGIYEVTLTVTVGGGCSATATQAGAVVVTNAPTAAFSYTPPLVNVLGPEVQFIDQSHGAGQWQWNFGDGQVSSQQHPTVNYGEDGIFLVELVVMNAEGCTDTARGYYEVAPLFTLYVPNAFTPNGNRKNEVFYAYGEGITRFRMRIFDRWGMELFESKQLTTGWDGTYNGQPVPMGVYVWQIEASSDFGDGIERAGHVTVLR